MAESSHEFEVTRAESVYADSVSRYVVMVFYILLSAHVWWDQVIGVCMVQDQATKVEVESNQTVFACLSALNRV